MNIRNRIVRLEQQNNPHGFCKCKQTQKYKTYTQDLTEDSDDTEQRLMSKPVQEKCENCRKPIDKQVFVIRIVDAKSNERFPDEMKMGA